MKEDHNMPFRSLLTPIPWVPLQAPVQSTLGQRSAELYDQVLDQFSVETNPRYAPRDGKTYCNIYVWDVTRAMHAEIPHWASDDGRSGGPATPGAHRLNVNAMARWLASTGVHQGWRRTSMDDALIGARGGHLAVAILANPAGHGHIAMLRPDPAIVLAQAGSVRFARGSLADAFDARVPDFWTHE